MSGDSGYRQKWTALGFGPLTSESTISVLGRLAYLNKLPVHVLKSEFGYLAGPRSRSFGRTCNVDSLKLSRETGWPIPLPEDQVMELRPVLTNYLFDRNFRYCPTCLNSGYHSYWHQFELLEDCPLHGLPLTDLCCRCELQIGAARTLLRAFGLYACPHCGMPLGGKDFSWDVHEKLRDELASGGSFARLDRWWTDSEGLASAEQMIAQNAVASWYVWGDARSVVQYTVQRLAPLLDGLKTRICPEFCMLRWSLRLHRATRARNDGVCRADPYARTAGQVYASTVYRLHDWIFPNGARSRSAAAMLNLRDKGEIQADPDEAREVAFAWFRLLYEDRMATAFEWLNPMKARLSLSQPMRHVGLRLQRLAARATYLAVYGVLLEMTRRQLSTEGSLRPSGTATIPSIVPLVYLPHHLESTTFHERSDGFVVFPAIPELDLSELWPCNLK